MRYAVPSLDQATVMAGRFAAVVPQPVNDRLVLRAPEVEDFAECMQIACVERGWFIDDPMTAAEARLGSAQMSADYIVGGHGLWTVMRDGETVGFVLIGLEPSDLAPEAELGVLFLAKGEGLGLVQEAAQAVMRFAAQELGFNTLVCCIDPLNGRAQAMATAIGGFVDGEVIEDDVCTLSYRLTLVGGC